MSTKKQARAKRPIPQNNFDQIDMYQSIALNAFKIGKGSHDAWEILAGAMNFGGLAVMRGHFPEFHAVFESGLQAIRDSKARFNSTGRWSLCHSEIKTLQVALNKHDVLMKSLPQKEVVSILTELYKRVEAMPDPQELQHAA